MDRDRYQQGAKFGDRHGDPGSCDAEKSRQKEKCSCCEQQSPAEGDDGGSLPVGQCSEKSRGRDVQSAEQEIDCEEFEACYGQDIGLRIFREYRRDRAGQKEGQERHKQGCTCCEQEGDLVQPAEFMAVLCAVLESDDGTDADSEPQVKSVEQKFSVEQDGDGGNAVFPGKAQENDIK